MYACADREAYALATGEVVDDVAVLDGDADRALDCPSASRVGSADEIADAAKADD